ncbi:MAG: 16S rRNA (cytidine(1402)-2'-O)-methyltransferase [Pseudomonadota bacterium]
MAESSSIDPGLHLVAVPIGTARDITLRALDILRGADVLAAEDTRSLRRLMDIHGVPVGGRPLLAYHDQNGPRMRPRLLQALRDGKSVAYASEAGTPLIADPGYQLGAAAHAEGVPVRAAPGASALLVALCVSGLPTDRFFFAGFLPPKSAARRTALEGLAQIPGTLVLYESPKRVAKMLADASDILGQRDAALCRELTKKFEEVWRGPLPDLADRAAKSDIRGEIVVLIEKRAEVEMSDEAVRAMLIAEMQITSLKLAVKSVTTQTRLPRKKVYDLALALKDAP